MSQMLCTEQKASTSDIPYSMYSVTMSPLSVLLVAAALLHCGLATTPATCTGVRATNTELFSGYDLKQRIAYRIGQVECLKPLLSEGNTQYGLGALNRGNYTTDITRFSLRQRITFLMGQVQCIKIQLSLEGTMTNISDNCNHHHVEEDSGRSQEPGIPNTSSYARTEHFYSN